MSGRALPRIVALSIAAAVAVGLPAHAAAAPPVHTIVIDKMKFGPMPTSLHVGDVVLWVNRDIFRHTATARDRSFNLDLAPGAKGKIVIKRSGAIPFACTFHPGMKGTLVVAPK